MSRHEERREALAAAAGGEAKGLYVRRVFSEIAPSYDFLNHLLSFNVDKRWRRDAIDALDWERCRDGTYVDVCAGTLDVSAELNLRRGFRGRVIAVDFAEPMLRAGLEKTRGSEIHPVVADALRLPLASGGASGVIVAFGARNLADLDAGFREMHRVLEPRGKAVVLEFSTPPAPMMRSMYHAYFRRVLPLVGRVVSGHPTAYRYLPESVAHFPIEEELVRHMEQAGFLNVRWRTLTLGVAAIHVGERGPVTGGRENVGRRAAAWAGSQ